jgi:hypothetical protein
MSPVQYPEPNPEDDALRRRPMMHVRYDDFDDDFDIGHRRESQVNESSAGMVGFIFSAVAIGLLLVVGVLWILLEKDEGQVRNPEGHRWMLYGLLFLDVLSVFAALTATVLGGRGLAPSNPLYRGWAITALILGIIEMIGTVIFFFIITCFALLFHAFG